MREATAAVVALVQVVAAALVAVVEAPVARALAAALVAVVEAPEARLPGVRAPPFWAPGLAPYSAGTRTLAALSLSLSPSLSLPFP